MCQLTLLDNGSTMSLPIDDDTTMVSPMSGRVPYCLLSFRSLCARECYVSVDNGSTMSLPIDDDTTMVVSHEWPCPLLSVVIP